MKCTNTWFASILVVFLYLLLLPEFHLHLLVPWLVFTNAMASNKVVADVSQLWVLLSCLFDKTEKEMQNVTEMINGILSVL